MNNKIKALLYSSNIWYFAEGMFGPLLAVYTEHIGGDIFDISWAWASYLIVTGIAMIVVGRLVSSEKVAERTMIFGYALNAVFVFGYLLVQNPVHLFIVQAGLGIATALATPTWNTLYSKHTDKGKATQEWGLADGEASIITGVAILLGGVVVGYFSFRVLFVAMGIIQVLSTLYLIRFYYKKY
jgi:MFS family permease